MKGRTPSRVLAAACGLLAALCQWPSHADEAETRMRRLSHPKASALAVSPNGDYLASARSDDIRLWDTSSGELLWTRPGHGQWHDPIVMGGGTNTLVFSESRLVSSGWDGNIRFWNVDDGELTGTIAPPWVFESGLPDLDQYRRVPISALALSSDGKRLAACMHGTIQILDRETGDLVGSIGGESLRTETLSLEELVASHARHDADKWAPAIIHGILKYPNDASPAELRCWKTMGTLPENLRSVSFADDDRRIVASGWSTTCVWDAMSGTLQLEVPNARYSAVSPRGELLVTGSPRGRTWIWDTKSLARAASHGEQVFGLAFAGDGKCLYARAPDGIQRWNTETWRMEGHAPLEYSEPPNLMAASSNARVVAVTKSNERWIRVWSPVGE